MGGIRSVLWVANAALEREHPEWAQLRQPVADWDLYGSLPGAVTFLAASPGGLESVLGRAAGGDATGAVSRWVPALADLRRHLHPRALGLLGALCDGAAVNGLLDRTTAGAGGPEVRFSVVGWRPLRLAVWPLLRMWSACEAAEDEPEEALEAGALPAEPPCDGAVRSVWVLNAGNLPVGFAVCVERPDAAGARRTEIERLCLGALADGRLRAQGRAILAGVLRAPPPPPAWGRPPLPHTLRRRPLRRAAVRTTRTGRA